MGEAILARASAGGGGVKYASGTINGVGGYEMTISNIGFTPKSITLCMHYTGGNSPTAVLFTHYDELNEVWAHGYRNSSGYFSVIHGWETVSGRIRVTFSDDNGGQAFINTASINDGGFPSAYTYTWIAVG